MTPYEAIGYTLINTTAVSAIVGAGSASAVFYGLRPLRTTLPSINYYEIGGGTRAFGMERQTFSLSCRAATPGAARDLAREVVTAFGGTSGTGLTGTVNGFDVARVSLGVDGGLIPEPEDNVFNAPVDIVLVYATTTVS